MSETPESIKLADGTELQEDGAFAMYVNGEHGPYPSGKMFGWLAAEVTAKEEAERKAERLTSEMAAWEDMAEHHKAENERLTTALEEIGQRPCECEAADPTNDPDGLEGEVYCLPCRANQGEEREG